MKDNNDEWERIKEMNVYELREYITNQEYYKNRMV